MSLNSTSASLLPVPVAVTVSGNESKLRWNRWTIVIGGAVLLVISGLLGGLLYYFLSLPSKASIPSPSSSSSDSASDSQQTTPTPASVSASGSGNGKYEALGCYRDGDGSDSAHVLAILAGSSFNVESCFQYAFLHQYAYFGLERGSDCYVGNGNYAANSNGASTISTCQLMCSDGSAGPCGGEGVLSIYSVNGVSVQCSHNEYYSSNADANTNFSGSHHGVCLPCGVNSSSLGGQSSFCSCTSPSASSSTSPSNSQHWVAGVGCSS